IGLHRLIDGLEAAVQAHELGEIGAALAAGGGRGVAGAAGEPLEAAGREALEGLPAPAAAAAAEPRRRGREEVVRQRRAPRGVVGPTRRVRLGPGSGAPRGAAARGPEPPHARRERTKPRPRDDARIAPYHRAARPFAGALGNLVDRQPSVWRLPVVAAVSIA